mgnify:CR=1 FL=1
MKKIKYLVIILLLAAVGIYIAKMGTKDKEKETNNSEVIDEEPEAKIPAFKLSEVTEFTMEEKAVIGYPHSGEIDMELIQKQFNEDMPKAGMFAAKEGLENYIPGAVWSVWDEEKNHAEYSIGLIVENADKMAEGMVKTILPAGKTLKISKWGTYGTGDKEAHEAINKYMAEKGLEYVVTWEEYVNDPSTVKPEETQTDIYYGVK